ncbi:MAG: BNR-4 repeat-containing protein [Bryobacteraceae bacterium]|nr:BNR repeat-containing protein [Bryobacterales bacterium]MEB2361326.1 BNR-4 repeat-containing protein [Bryobacterales bacterium]NUN03487.1 BNR-4 repeat-containing protein [Bryobacteraceae bacterium]
MHPFRTLFPVLFAAVFSQSAVPPKPITINDDGAWCWFQDERAAVLAGTLITGSIAAGVRDAARRGDVEAVTYEFATGRQTRSELHDRLLTSRKEYDDHNAPAFFIRPDRRVLAVYSMHGPENRFYYRVSEPGDATRWSSERYFIPTPNSRITYSNLLFLAKENGGKGRLYNFYRGLDNSFKPSYAFSDDLGETWQSGNIVIDVPSEFRHRPYVKYASNGEDTIHLFYTEAHPRDFDNSTYHVFYKNGNLYRSGGSLLRSLKEGLRKPEEGTRIFRGNPDNVAWVSDIHLDSAGRPYVAYTVQKDSAGLPRGQGGMDLRYRYARWTGTGWRDYEVAHAGSRLYPGEDDYTGNIALNPQDPDMVVISTNAAPVSGKPLVSSKDNQRHYELFQGVTKDGGRSWKWTALTPDPVEDHLRPIIPHAPGAKTAILWLKGVYRSYTNYNLSVMLLYLAGRP